MTALSIELTAAERELLGQIELNALALKNDYVAVRRNGKGAAQLMELFLQRKAIPRHRIAYFTDPQHNSGGRGSSRQQQFQRNMHSGEMFEHPHFLAYLRYFIHGPDLPDAVIAAFREKVEDCGQITSGDIMPLAKHARQLTRIHGLNPRDASEEFYKLALENGLDSDYAEIVEKQVRTLR